MDKYTIPIERNTTKQSENDTYTTETHPYINESNANDADKVKTIHTPIKPIEKIQKLIGTK